MALLYYDIKSIYGSKVKDPDSTWSFDPIAEIREKSRSILGDTLYNQLQHIYSTGSHIDEVKAFVSSDPELNYIDDFQANEVFGFDFLDSKGLWSQKGTVSELHSKTGNAERLNCGYKENGLGSARTDYYYYLRTKRGQITINSNISGNRDLKQLGSESK